MGRTHQRWYPTPERWTPALFIVGGGLVIGHAAVRGIEAFTAVPPPPDVFGPPGYLLALLGLLGLYPALAGRAPMVARAAAVVAVIPLVNWVVISAWGFGAAAGVLAPQSAVFPGTFYLVHLVLLTLTYSFFGVAILRAGAYSRTVGGLVLTPPVLFVALMVGGPVLGDVAIGAFIVGSGQALVHLMIGAALWTSIPTETPALAGDTTVG